MKLLCVTLLATRLAHSYLTLRAEPHFRTWQWIDIILQGCRLNSSFLSLGDFGPCSTVFVLFDVVLVLLKLLDFKLAAGDEVRQRSCLIFERPTPAFFQWPAAASA